MRLARWLVAGALTLVGLELGLSVLPGVILQLRGTDFGDGERHLRFVGDSVTFGYGVPATASFPALIANGSVDLHVRNLARPGLRFDQGLDRLEVGLQEQPGGVSVVMLGHNDITTFGTTEVREEGLRLLRTAAWLFSVVQGEEIGAYEVPRSWLAERLERAVTLARTYDSALVLGTYATGPKAPEDIVVAQQDLNEKLRLEAERLGLPLVDLATLPHDIDTVFDTIHLTEAGHALAAEAVVATLTEHALLDDVDAVRSRGPTWERRDLLVGEAHPEREYQAVSAARLAWVARARARLAVATGDTERAIALLEEAAAAIAPLARPYATEPEVGVQWQVSYRQQPVAVADPGATVTTFVPDRPGAYRVDLLVRYEQSAMQRTVMVPVAAKHPMVMRPPGWRQRQLLSADIEVSQDSQPGQPVTLDARGSTMTASTQLIQLDLMALERSISHLRGLPAESDRLGPVRSGRWGAAQAGDVLRQLTEPRQILFARDELQQSAWQLNLHEAALELTDPFVDVGAWGPWEPAERMLHADALQAMRPRLACGDLPMDTTALGTCVRRIRTPTDSDTALDGGPDIDTLAAVGGLSLRRPPRTLGCEITGLDSANRQWARARREGPEALVEVAHSWMMSLERAPESCRGPAQLRAWHLLVTDLAQRGHFEAALTELERGSPADSLRVGPAVSTPALRGRMLAELGRLEEAEASLAEAAAAALQDLGKTPVRARSDGAALSIARTTQ